MRKTTINSPNKIQTKRTKNQKKNLKLLEIKAKILVNEMVMMISLHDYFSRLRRKKKKKVNKTLNKLLSSIQKLIFSRS